MPEWEEKEQVDPERESIETAISKAVEKLKDAYIALSEAVDGESGYFDRVMSYAYEIEDMVDNLNMRKGVF